SFYMPILVFLSPRRAHEISKVGYRKERKEYEEKLKLHAKKSREEDITQLENRIRTLEEELAAKCTELDSLLADIPPPPPNPAPPPPRPNIGSSRESLNSNHSQTRNTNGNHHNRSLEEETHAFSKDNNDPFVPKLSNQQREIERHNIATFETGYIPQRNSDQRLLLNNLLSEFEFDLNDDDKTVNSTDIDIDQIEMEYSDSPLQLLASLPNLCRTAKNETDPNKKMEALQNIKNYLDAWIIELDKIDNKRDTTRLAELRQKSFSEIQQSQNDKINSEINNATEKKRNDTLKALQYLNLEEIQKSSIAQRRFNHWLVAQHNNNTYVELELCNDSKIQDIQAKVESYIKRSQSINCCIDDVLNDTVYLTLTALLRHYAESADGRKYSNQYA
ncbi:MAG: hypothetical protein VX777_06795, partial [Chlamydiota bacterium]|nr:hypothetical protein [Chlamydiota bacterium]